MLAMITLYDYLDSGNGFKIRLLLAQLKQPYRWIEKDILASQTRTPEFLAKNPNGRIPALELDDGTVIAESNAILWYLAEGSPFIPDNRLQRAQVLQWMFFEQYSHEPYVATPRFIVKHLPADSPRHAELPDRMARGRAALGVMDTHLAQQPFFVGGSLHARRYSAVRIHACAHEAGFDLAPYKNVRGWIERVASQPGYVSIYQRPAN